MTHLRQRMQEDLRLCSVRMGEIPPCDSGVCTWPRAEASSPASGHRCRRSQAGSTASSHLDHPGAIHPVLWRSSLRREIMSKLLQLPASR